MLSRIRLVFPEPLPTTLLGRDLERPKSQIFTLQSSSTRMFADLISRCIILMEWRYFKAHKVLYMMRVTWSEVRISLLALKTVFSSVPKCSITMNKFIWPLSVVVYMSINSNECLFKIVSFRIIWISRMVFTALYSFSEQFSIYFMATLRPEILQVAKTTCPKLPWPMIFLRV